MALKGFARYFKKASDEERVHAEKFMTYQNKRGGRIVLQDIKVYADQFDLFLFKRAGLHNYAFQYYSLLYFKLFQICLIPLELFVKASKLGLLV